MSADFFKILSPVISELLYNLFNGSFSLDIFPDHIKLEMVSPIFKWNVN